jgi:mannose/fructose/N-acetylgalactosamine-specific phosphotransferase system component IID
MNEFFNLIFGIIGVYCLFFVARAGWERGYDKIKNMNIDKVENVTFDGCKIAGRSVKDA